VEFEILYDPVAVLRLVGGAGSRGGTEECDPERHMTADGREVRWQILLVFPASRSL
jgi:hypothetical protein